VNLNGAVAFGTAVGPATAVFTGPVTLTSNTPSSPRPTARARSPA
jgi:hypothetical protein